MRSKSIRPAVARESVRHPDFLLSEVAGLASCGASTRRVRFAVEDAVAGWASEASGEALRERLDGLRVRLGRGIEAARRRSDRLDGAGAAHVERTIAALRAAQAALVPPLEPVF